MNEFLGLDLDGVYMGKIYTLFVIIPSQFLFKGALYCRHGNTPIPEHMNYDTQLCFNSTN